jgi:hypothetical protein
MVENRRVFRKNLFNQNMRTIFFWVGILMFLTSCWLPGRDFTQAKFIEESNASPVQKRAMWEGCMIANTRENAPTSVRDLAQVSIDGTMTSNGEYKAAYSYGFYYCHLARSMYSNSYTRSGWNVMGFKGDSIAYKSEM